MDKIVKGTKDRKRYEIIKGSPDQREIRCTKCKGVATQAPDGKGGFICSCTSCGTKFRFQKL